MKEAMLYEKLGEGKVRCQLCAHRCEISSGKSGICRVRKNQAGRLYSLVYAKAVAANIDPIEKKPFYHFYPQSQAYSIATLGCNFKCQFCQNWSISQTQPDRYNPVKDFQPQAVVEEAKANNCLSIAYTYSEPTVFFEYAYETAKLSASAGINNVFVTNGYLTEEAIEVIAPYLAAANVDLKSFSQRFYSTNCQAKLKPVLEAIKLLKAKGIWLEITTLIIPGENDSRSELTELAEFIASVGREIPWHISRFHPDYKFSEHQPTSLAKLEQVKAIGRAAGLRYVYLGNVLEDTDTYCYNCNQPLVRRSNFGILENRLNGDKCPFCHIQIDGRFN